jgi:hypothetical protein
LKTNALHLKFAGAMNFVAAGRLQGEERFSFSQLDAAASNRSHFLLLMNSTSGKAYSAREKGGTRKTPGQCSSATETNS